MDLVKNLDHFRELIIFNKSQGARSMSNCLFLPDYVKKITDESNLFFVKNSGGLFFLKRELGFFLLYYEIPDLPGTQLDFQFLDEINEPILLNIIYSQNSTYEKIQSDTNFWLANKFHLRKNFRRMNLKGGPTKVDLKIPNGMEFDIRYGSRNEMDVLQKLWQSSLDLLSNSLPTEMELINSIDNHELFCLIDTNNKIIGALQCSKRGASLEISRVSVDSRFRGLGLGYELITRSLKTINFEGHYFLWVAEDNLPAIKLYEKLGFNFDGKIIKQFIWKNNIHNMKG